MPVVPSEDAWRRVQAAVRAHERPGAPAGAGARTWQEPVWARLTSGTADGSGHYPAVLTLPDAAGAWQDYSAVKVAPLNGETLSNATRYSVRPSGRTAGGDELYTVIGSTAAAGGPVALVRVKSDSGVANYWNARLVTWNAATNAWVEGDTDVIVYAYGEGSTVLNVNLATDEKIYAVHPLDDTMSGKAMYYLPNGQVWLGGDSATGRVVQGVHLSDSFAVTFDEVAGASVAAIDLSFGYADLTHDGLVSTETQVFGGNKLFPGGVDVAYLTHGTTGYNGGLSQPDDTYFEIDSLRTVGVSFWSRLGHAGSLSEQAPYIQFNSGPASGSDPPDYYSITVFTPRLTSWDPHTAVSGVGQTGDLGDYTFINGICTGYSGSSAFSGTVP